VIEGGSFKEFAGLDDFPYLKKEAEPASETCYYIDS